MKYGVLLLASLVSIASQGAWAGNSEGNGGNGIRIGKKTYVLDLVEAGVQDDVYTPSGDCADQLELSARIDLAVNSELVPERLVAGKICELKKLNPLLAYSLLRAIEMYDWRFLQFPLLDTDDDDTDVSMFKGQHVQLATRGERSIRIDAKLYLKLSETHRAALILHEAVYALIYPDQFGERYHPYYRQSSRIAREVTGYLFTPQLASKGASGLERKLSSSSMSYLPSGGSAIEFKDSKGSVEVVTRSKVRLDTNEFGFLSFTEISAGKNDVPKLSEISDYCEKTRALKFRVFVRGSLGGYTYNFDEFERSSSRNGSMLKSKWWETLSGEELLVIPKDASTETCIHDVTEVVTAFFSPWN